MCAATRARARRAAETRREKTSVDVTHARRACDMSVAKRIRGAHRPDRALLTGLARLDRISSSSSSSKGRGNSLRATAAPVAARRAAALVTLVLCIAWRIAPPAEFRPPVIPYAARSVALNLGLSWMRTMYHEAIIARETHLPRSAILERDPGSSCQPTDRPGARARTVRPSLPTSTAAEHPPVNRRATLGCRRRRRRLERHQRRASRTTLAADPPRTARMRSNCVSYNLITC